MCCHMLFFAGFLLFLRCFVFVVLLFLLFCCGCWLCLSFCKNDFSKFVHLTHVTCRMFLKTALSVFMINLPLSIKQAVDNQGLLVSFAMFELLCTPPLPCNPLWDLTGSKHLRELLLLDSVSGLCTLALLWVYFWVLLLLILFLCFLLFVLLLRRRHNAHLPALPGLFLS